MSVSEPVVVNDIQPTDPQFQTQREDKELSCWSNTVNGEFYSQEPFLEYGPTFINATCGLGSGKTVMGIIRAVANAEYWNPGYPGMIISPTVPNLKNAILPEMRKWGILDDWEFKGKGSDEPGLHSPNGTRIILESADNDRKIGRLRGPSVSWVWMDEPAEIAPRAFEVAIGRVRTGNYQNIFVTGTPKGKNWVYDKFHPDSKEQLDDVLNLLEIPSFANPHNPDSYENILNQYSGSFYEQEALGKFVDFEGLIYKWFSDDHVIETSDAPDKYDETIYMVDWGGSNPTALLACVREGDYWYFVDEFYERRVVNADVIAELESMESEWGAGPIYCDHEPRSIKELQNNGFNAKPAEKDVSDGIRYVSGLRDNIRVCDHLQNLINEFNSYQYKDGGDSDKPVKQNDHCLVGETKIMTPRGERELRDIRTGDRVLTRGGFKRVTDAGITRQDAPVERVYLSDGRAITATKEHLFHTPADGFIQLDALGYGTELSSIKTCPLAWQTLMQSSTTTSSSGAIPTATTSPTGITTVHTPGMSRTASKRSTVKSGKNTTARYPTGTTSTTSTAIQQTTTSATSNVLARENTSSDTRTSAVFSPTNTTQRCSKPRRGGTRATKVQSGIANTGTNPSPKRSQTPRKCVTNAESRSPTKALKTPGDSVQTPVRLNTDESPASTTRHVSVKRVNSLLRSTSTATHRPVHVLARERLDHGRDVYNLEVEGQHEYFANGLLVHNSMDAMRYGLYTHTDGPATGAWTVV